MSPITEFVSGLSSGQRTSLVAGVLVIVAACTGLYLWAYQTDLQPLYTDLGGPEAAKVLAELDEMKIAHSLSADGKSIMVDSAVAGETRIRLDGSNPAMNGGQGFELFDNADYGMTEFVQKINYQRALQGEIARTVMGLGVVRQARVHLVLPEQGLFQQAQTVPKASVTVVQEPQAYLSVAQIAGIQQLVASAVEGMDADSVTVLDERGVVLTESHAQDGKRGGPSLGRKQEIEEYLGLKAGKILDQLYDPGVAVVNIDVTLSTEQVQLTRETYNSPEKSGQGGIAASSKTQRKFAGASDDYGNESKKQLASEVTEIDYRLDKSVEQVVRGDGAVERMTVSVMVPRAVDAVTLKAIRQLVATAVGLRESRGDTIEVYGLPVSAHQPSGAVAVAPSAASAAGGTVTRASGRAPGSPRSPGIPFAALVAVVLLLGAGGLYLAQRRASTTSASLSEGQREALLEEVKFWFDEESKSRPADGAPSPGVT